MSWLCHIFTIRLIIVFLSSFELIVSANLTSALADDLEHYVHRLVNEHRVSQGLKPLTFNPKIAAIARRHSQDMATGRVGFSHGGFESRREKIAGFIAQPWVGENVAANNGDFLYAGEGAVSGWLQSPGHRRNIEGSYDLTGVGIAQGPAGEYYFTQLFVRVQQSIVQEPMEAIRRIRVLCLHRVTERASPESSKPGSHLVISVRKENPRREKDPRKRPGRKRTDDGWVQTLD